MNAFTRSISQIFKGAVEAFKTFPAAIGFAMAFAIVTIIRIQLDWPQQEAYNFLFNCLHWSFALGALFSLAAITAAQSRFGTPKAFLTANLISILIVACTFMLLYFMGGNIPDFGTSRYYVISALAVARVSAVMLISFISFIYLAGYPKEQSDYAKSFFMTHKAFFIALIYGAVIMSGVSGVAGAFQALLYHDMTYKVYMYIGTITGFLAFTIFLGYFPDFRKGQTDEKREVAQKQPRFIEILFVYIMIPILLALTVVLLLWAGRIILARDWPPFFRLSGIATSYAIGGLWLHIMVTHYESGLTKFYRRFYPIAAIIILAFEAWALMNQLGKSGLKIEEYSFGLIWIVTIVAVVLLLILKARAHPLIAGLTCLIALVAVMPIVGYNVLPVKAQSDRLEKLLVSQNMFENGTIKPALVEPEENVREAITDAVTYLAYANNAKLPEWFDRNLGDNEVFIKKLGFGQTWPKPDDYDGNGSGDYMGTSLYLETEAIDISDYKWVLNVQQDFVKEKGYVTLNGDNGNYRVYWIYNTPDNVPTLKIVLNDIVILEEDMNEYLNRISIKYPPGRGQPQPAALEDMSIIYETPEISAMLVFRNVDVYVNTRDDYINYGFNPAALYLKEKN